MTANVSKCAVLVCNEDKNKPVEFKWKRGGEELPIVGKYTYLGVENSKNCSWDAHINKVIQKGKPDVIVPKLEYAGEVWEGNTKLADKLETVQMTAAKKILGCSKTTSNTALRVLEFRQAVA